MTFGFIETRGGGVITTGAQSMSPTVIQPILPPSRFTTLATGVAAAGVTRAAEAGNDVEVAMGVARGCDTVDTLWAP